jgi:hypothetical protein
MLLFIVVVGTFRPLFLLSLSALGGGAIMFMLACEGIWTIP